MPDTWLRDILEAAYQHQAALHGAPPTAPEHLAELERYLARWHPGDVKAKRASEALLKSANRLTRDLATSGLAHGGTTPFARTIHGLAIRPTTTPMAPPPQALGAISRAIVQAKRTAYVAIARRAGKYLPSARAAAERLFPLTRRLGATAAKRVLLPLGTAMDLYDIGRTGALGLSILQEGAEARDLERQANRALEEARIEVGDTLDRRRAAAILSQFDWILADLDTTADAPLDPEPYEAPPPARTSDRTWGDFTTAPPPATTAPDHLPLTAGAFAATFPAEAQASELADWLEQYDARERRQFAIDMYR